MQNKTANVLTVLYNHSQKNRNICSKLLTNGVHNACILKLFFKFILNIRQTFCLKFYSISVLVFVNKLRFI